jgi:hypothetical protein
MGDAKLDDPSSGVNNTLIEAGGLMEETAELLDGFAQEVKDGRQAFYRAESAVASGRALIVLVDPSITPKQVAEEVKESAANLLANVRQAEPSGGTDGGTIAGPAEQLLTALNNIRQPSPVEEKAKDAARRYSQSLNPRMQAIKREIDALEARLSEFSESASSQSTEISERVDGLKGELESAGTRIDELISDQDAKFTEAQEKRREEHTQAINDATERLTEARSSFDERRDKATARLDEIEKEVAEAAAAIGASTAGVDHGAESARQTKLAFRWSLATIALLLVAALVSIFALEILKANQSPEAVAGKITVALLIAGVAGYAGGLAHHHRERAANARRLEIEMNAFGPFIATLDREDRNDLRSTAVWRFFGPNAAPPASEGDPRPGPRIAELWNERRAKRRAKHGGDGVPPSV